MGASVGRGLARSLLPGCVRDDPAEYRVLGPVTYVAFAALTVLIVATSCIEYAHAAYTQDFATYYQAVYQIAHGNFNPADTFSGLDHFWQGHFELHIWLLAPLVALFPSQLTLQLAQDAAGIVTFAIAWRWSLTILYGGAKPVPYRRLIALCALCALVFDPWIYWTYAFDVHSEPFAIAFLVSAAYAFYLGRPYLGFALALGVLLEGDVTSTYLAGFGLTILIVRWRQPWFGLALLALGVGWLQLIHAVGSGQGSAINPNYGYFVYGVYTAMDPSFPELTARDLGKFILTHPLTVMYALKDKVTEIYANTAPFGFIGILSPWAVGVSLLVLMENQLAFALTFSQPIFQNIPLYVFGTVGFAWMLSKLAPLRYGRFAAAFAVLVAINTAGWAAVWIPQIYPHWIRTSGATAATVAQVARRIDPADQVVATQGIVGAFADHRSASSLWFGDRPVPWQQATIDFVILPYEGINVEPVNRSLAALDSLVNTYHAQLRDYDHGVWWLSVTGTPGGMLHIPAGAEDVPAWGCTGPAGSTDVFGPPNQWNSFTDNTRGYVVSRAYWREPFGNFRAGALLSSTGPVVLEVWDQTADQPIVRKAFAAGPRRWVGVDFRHLDRGLPSTYKGFAPFVIEPVEPPVHDVLEVRVFSDGGGVVRVYRVRLNSLSPDA